MVSTIIHTNVSGAPLKGKVSGKENLTYITIQADLKEELKTFQKIVPFKKVALISDALIPKVMPKIKDFGHKAAKELGIDLRVIPYSGHGTNLVSKIPHDMDAVLIGALPRMQDQEVSKLLQLLTQRGVPTYSMVSAHFVNLGALASAMPLSNHNQYAKRFALGIQSVLLGEKLKDLKVFINRDRTLNINRKTAKALNIPASFEMLLESKSVGVEEDQSVKSWDLKKVSKHVLLENLTVEASKLNVDIGSEQVQEKEAQLYPQLALNVNHQHRKDTGLNTIATESGKASLSLNQILYDPSTWANLDIEKLQQKTRNLTHKQTQLDILEDANIAFLNVLKAKTLKKIQEDNMQLSLKNLKLAKNKAKIGSATNADIYRWESELANAQADFLTANADLKASTERLNQLLNRPLYETFYIKEDVLDNPIQILDNADWYRMLSDNGKFTHLSKAFTAYGVNNAPEIATYLTQISVQRRTLKREKQRYYMPTLSLNGEYSDTYHDSRSRDFSQEGENDWMVGANMSLPLYEGGGRTHSVNHAKITLNQLHLQLQETKHTISQKIRDALRKVQVSKFSIKLKQKAATAAEKNYDLVYDAYSKGSTGIIDLLDAQNAKIIANLNAVNSTYQFFSDLVKLQRAIGNIDFFVSDDNQHLAHVTGE